MGLLRALLGAAALLAALAAPAAGFYLPGVAPRDWPKVPPPPPPAALHPPPTSSVIRGPL